MKGSALFNTVTRTAFKPCEIIVEAAKFALDQNASRPTAVKILRKRVAHSDEAKNPPKIYSLIAVAHNRVLEPIRELFLS